MESGVNSAISVSNYGPVPENVSLGLYVPMNVIFPACSFSNRGILDDSSACLKAFYRERHNKVGMQTNHKK